MNNEMVRKFSQGKFKLLENMHLSYAGIAVGGIKLFAYP